MNSTRRNPLIIAALALLLAACQPSDPGTDSGITQPSKPTQLHLVNRVDHLAENAAREPMLALHPDGTLFVGGYGRQDTGTDWTVPPLLWKSGDAGDTWSKVDVGTSGQGAQGNSDVDLTVAADGTVYFLTMGFNRSTRAGTHITMGVSRDVGASWQWNMLSKTEFDDRPWVAVTPDSTAHAIWNDGAGVRYFQGQDGGNAWSEQPRISDQGGSSHLAAGPDGELAVRVSNLSASGNQYDEGADAIAVSTDGGSSWQLQDIPGTIEWDPTFSDPNKIMRWVEPLAWGPDSTLYHLWSEGSEVFLARSADLGETWYKTLIHQTPGKSFFPYLISNHRGQLLASWYDIEGTVMTGRIAHIDASATVPAVTLADPLQLQAWNGESPDTAGEYLTAEFLPNGEIGAVTTIQDGTEGRYGFTFWRFSLR